MNQLMLEIKDYYISDEIIKFIKEYFINFIKIMKRLQLIVFNYKKSRLQHSSDYDLYFK